MAKPPSDPLAPITIEQSKASAAIRGLFVLICGIVLIVVAMAGLFSGETGMAVRAPYAGFLGLGALGYGISQIKLSKQENRTQFHADTDGMRGLVLESPELVPWSSVSNIRPSFNDLSIDLVDGRVIHIRESMVGLTKGLKGLPSSKKIGARLESLRANAQVSEPQASL